MVSGVLAGHGHDRAGPVAHQHVVRDEDRDRLAVHRVDRRTRRRRRRSSPGSPAGRGPTSARRLGGRPRPPPREWRRSRSIGGRSRPARTRRRSRPPAGARGRGRRRWPRTACPVGWCRPRCDSGESTTPKRTRAPVERPIQLRCMILIDSGQSSRSRSSISRSAYAVIRIIHCRRVRLNTGKLPMALRPSAVTSSLDSTVPRPGHQLTGPSAAYTSRCWSSRAARSTRSRSAHARSPGTGRSPAANSATSSAIGRARCRVSVVERVEQPGEDPLGPAHERGIGGGHAAALVVTEAEPPQLRPVARDVLVGGDGRVGAGADGVLLGGQSEGVEADRVQHVVAGHPQDNGPRRRCRCSRGGARRAARRRRGRGTCRARTSCRPAPEHRRSVPGRRPGWPRGTCPRGTSGPASRSRSGRPGRRCSGAAGCRARVYSSGPPAGHPTETTPPGSVSSPRGACQGHGA